MNKTWTNKDKTVKIELYSTPEFCSMYDGASIELSYEIDNYLVDGAELELNLEEWFKEDNFYLNWSYDADNFRNWVDEVANSAKEADIQDWNSFCDWLGGIIEDFCKKFFMDDFITYYNNRIKSIPLISSNKEFLLKIISEAIDLCEIKKVLDE